MSEFHVRVVEIGDVKKHENADSLEITYVGGEGGYPCVIKSGEFKPGDKAVYIPIGASLPADDARWDFLRTKIVNGERCFRPGPVEIEAVRLRGTFSMGLLTQADPSWEIGRNVADELRIVRAEPPEPTEGNEADPGLLPSFTDIFGLRAYPNVLREGEEVYITEKIHGETMMAALGPLRDGDLRRHGHLYCGSRTAWKHPDGGPIGGVAGNPLREHHWWNVARRIGLEERLARCPGIGVYGEIFGDVPCMKYGATSSRRGLRLFSAMDTKSRSYLDYDDFLRVAERLEIQTAPLLYRGPWRSDLRDLADGNSLLADHIREGMVVAPARERFDPAIGRVILKLHGKEFLLSKGKKKPVTK